MSGDHYWRGRDDFEYQGFPSPPRCNSGDPECRRAQRDYEDGYHAAEREAEEARAERRRREARQEEERLWQEQMWLEEQERQQQAEYDHWLEEQQQEEPTP